MPEPEPVEPAVKRTAQAQFLLKLSLKMPQICEIPHFQAKMYEIYCFVRRICKENLEIVIDQLYRLAIWTATV